MPAHQLLKIDTGCPFRTVVASEINLLGCIEEAKCMRDGAKMNKERKCAENDI